MSESETRQLTCPNGHTFDAPDSDAAPGTVSCPKCEADVSVESSPSKSGSGGRSLWAVMGQGGGDDEKSDKPSDSEPSTANEGKGSQPESDEVPDPPSFLKKKVVPVESVAGSDPSDSEPETSDDDPSNAATEDASKTEASPDDTDESRGRGLWAMMGVGAKADEESSAESADEPVAESSDEQPGASADGEENFDTAVPSDANDNADVQDDARVGDEPDIEVEPDIEDEADEGDLEDRDWSLADEDEEDGWDVEDPQADLDDLDSLLPPPVPTPDEGPPPGRRKGIAALVAGSTALLFAGLTILPWFWVKFPSTVAGVIALVFGYQAMGEGRRVRGCKAPVTAPLGMALGLAGMFAGPAFLNELGNDMRERASAEAVRANLVRIGEALSRYHAEHGRFPAGGEWEDIDGVEIGMHGWMTSLLPYLEQNEIVSAIDRTKPWNDPVNLPAMSQPVPHFLVPDIEHAPNSQGYATAHYSGVGGEIMTDEGRYVLGIFGRDVRISRFDVTDGLSQTMVVGEINRNFPAWGSTGNWRQTGRGLNQDPAGFGNADGTGAHFLMADGSVRFLPNRTSPEVLDRLSTRDADDGDPLPPVTE